MSSGDDSVLADYARKTVMLEQQNRSLNILASTLLHGEACWSELEGDHINTSLPDLISLVGYGDSGVRKVTQRVLVQSTFYVVEGEDGPLVFREEDKDKAYAVVAEKRGGSPDSESGTDNTVETSPATEPSAPEK